MTVESHLSDLSEEEERSLSRRAALAGFVTLSTVSSLALRPPPANAANFSDLATAVLTPPPPGFLVNVDRFDGYSFIYPSTWVEVRAGEPHLIACSAAFQHPTSLVLEL